jgi:hypothetical protein
MRSLLWSLSSLIAVGYFVVFPDHLLAAIGWVTNFVR